MPTLAERLREEGRLEGIKEVREEAREKARKEGKREAKLEISKNLIKMGYDIDLIAKATGLKKKELEELAAQSH
jgi:predicted transposase/invertase (TIGR01784 family)